MLIENINNPADIENPNYIRTPSPTSIERPISPTLSPSLSPSLSPEIHDNKFCIICMDEEQTDNLVLNKNFLISSACQCEYYVHHLCFKKWLTINYTARSRVIKCLICRSNVRINDPCRDCCNCFYGCFNPRCLFYVITCGLVILILMSSDINLLNI